MNFIRVEDNDHIILIPWLFHWPDPGLTFDVAVHIGTLLVVLVYFWKDWVNLIRHGLTQGFASHEGRMVWFIVLASIPGAVAGFLFEEQIQTVFRGPVIMAIMLIVMGIIRCFRVKALQRSGAAIITLFFCAVRADLISGYFANNSYFT